MLGGNSQLNGRKILVTGHSGFTGSWLSLWLKTAGCRVAGLSLPPESVPSMFRLLDLENLVESEFGDINDFATVSTAIRNFQPELVVHLAAQPLVRKSYGSTLETIRTNALGTANILEAVRRVDSVSGVLLVTTDKVYAERDDGLAHQESDRLGGFDPYGCSKAAAEMVISAYRAVFRNEDRSLIMAVARGGNIIGGGDWSADRLVPDLVRGISSQRPVPIRNPEAVRPWQHVLSLVHGYVTLLIRMTGGEAESVSRPWNFGPLERDHVDVTEFLRLFGKAWKLPATKYVSSGPPETTSLRLDSSLARQLLGWCPPWTIHDVIRETASWYRTYYEGKDIVQYTSSQMRKYQEAIA